MINFNLQVRRAVREDHRQIASLIFHETNTHRHLDWRSALDWIGTQNYWVLDDNGSLTAAFACPEDPPGVAWVRLFTHQSHLAGPEAWSAIWESAKDEIFRTSSQTRVAAIVVKQWFQEILLNHGFNLQQDIVLLNRPGDRPVPSFMMHGFHIRSMRSADLPAVARLDLAAFGSFWHNTEDSLQRAFAQAIHATVAENESGMVGYQISTGNPFGIHLARLGVCPDAQGQGVGSALVSDLIRQTSHHSIRRITVNTQSDNQASLALYQKMGFVRTGEYFPVLVYGESHS